MSPDNCLSAREFWTDVVRAHELLRQVESASDVDVCNKIIRALDEPFDRLAAHYKWDQRFREHSTKNLVAGFLRPLGETNLDSLLDAVRATTNLVATQPSELQAALEGGIDPLNYVVILRCVFSAVRQHCVIAELERRLARNEKRNGKVVREFLVERRDATGEEQTKPFDRLRRLVLWNTEQLPGDLAGEEKQSMATLSILDELHPFYSLKPVALDPKGLEALVEGRFNQIGWRIHESVRAEVRRERKLVGRRIDVAEQEDPDDVLDAFQPQQPDTGPTEARWVLESLVQYLTPRQIQFLEIRLQVDTDKEAAERMEITPGAASQLWSHIKRTARKHRP